MCVRVVGITIFVRIMSAKAMMLPLGSLQGLGVRFGALVAAGWVQGGGKMPAYKDVIQCHPTPLNSNPIHPALLLPTARQAAHPLHRTHATHAFRMASMVRV